jgi:hypothetical protein
VGWAPRCPNVAPSAHTTHTRTHRPCRILCMHQRSGTWSYCPHACETNTAEFHNRNHLQYKRVQYVLATSLKQPCNQITLKSCGLTTQSNVVALSLEAANTQTNKIGQVFTSIVENNEATHSKQQTSKQANKQPTTHTRPRKQTQTHSSATSYGLAAHNIPTNAKHEMKRSKAM